jgi:PDZ domain
MSTLNNKHLVFHFAIILLPYFLISCANGYKEFYQPAQGTDPASIAKYRVSPSPLTPLVEHSQPADSHQILDAYAKRGYLLIGNSMFNSGKPESDDAAIRQGQEVGADLVLILNPKYTGTIISTVPITTPTTSTSYATGSATAYGSGGTVHAYGRGTTTTYGSSTEYIPISVQRSDYGALYFVKNKWSLGVLTRELNDSERQELQTNKGAMVNLVVDETPAFDADILVGDVIKSIDGATVSDANLTDIIRERRGRRVTISILRQGKPIEKVVQLKP